MQNNIRSGNSRLLARNLDHLDHPLAVLDSRGVVVYANQRLCELVKADSTQLVGLQSSWQVAADESPFAALLTALAPPAGAREGRITARQLTTPVVFGSDATGQLFVPLLESDSLVHSTLVILGNWEVLQNQLTVADGSTFEDRQHEENAIQQLRSRWELLDGLHPLIGRSPSVELAMVRIQLAIQQTCSVFLSGPQAVGKSELAYGIYTARHRREGTPRNSGQFFPVDCQVLSDELLVAMLEVLASRLQNNVPAKLHMLVLERCEHLTLSGVDALQAWLEKHGNHCTLVATSRARFDELASKGAGWNRLMTRLCELEVMIPRLKERPEDIMPLALNYLALHCRNKERALLRFSSDAQKLLTSFPWPGNLRQLSSAVEEAVDHAVLSAVIHVNHLPVSIRTFPGTAEQLSSSKFEPIKLDEVLLEFEKIILSRALKLSPRNRARAARWLGISRPRLLRRIAQLGLDVEKRNSSQE